MKRALAICAAVMMFGVASFGLNISGSWTGSFDLLPNLGFLSTTLNLKYTVGGFDITSTSTFTGSGGFTSQSFGFSGSLAGLITLTGDMGFDPTVPEYTDSSLKMAMDLLGVNMSLLVEHWADASVPGLCDDSTDPALLYTLSTTFDPLTLRARFLDCCTGTAFYDLLITLSGLDLCCGITYDFELSFLKSGFDYAKFTLANLFTVMDFITFDVSITYGVDYKAVSVTPSFGPFATTCVQVYGNWLYDGGVPENPEDPAGSQDLYIRGIRIDGFKIYCDLGDCNYAEFVTFFSPQEAPSGMGFISIDVPDSDITVQEFEYFKLGFCGPGCCGGQWTADIAVYFHDTPGVSLFAISRMAANFSVPIMDNLTITSNFTTNAITGETTLGFGWTFTF